jgi:hypothetical protein
LPPEDDIAGVVARLADFHAAFLKKYGGLDGGGGGSGGATAGTQTNGN